MPHKFNQARRHKFEQAKYRIQNWRDYESSLRRRGDVRLWISEEAIAGWHAKHGRGVYSDPGAGFLISGCGRPNGLGPVER